jgi:hypothetical protein
MSLIIPANSAAASGGFAVDNSCRFNSGSDYMVKTSSSVANQTKGTISVWVKRGNLSADMQIIGQTSTEYTRLMFRSTNKLRFYSNLHDLETNRLFRDVSAWYHIMVTWDTTQGTAANRVKMYVNGVQETSFATATYPDQNAELQFFINSTNIDIARNVAGSDDYFDGYMAEFVGLEGTAAAYTDFGEFDEDSGIWKPIENDQSGNKGANGFFLDFQDSANLGNDAYGGTDFTETGLAAIDQTTDTPTNNFATLNPLYKLSNVTFSEGNLQHTNSADWQPGLSTIGVSSGKWYYESKFTAVTEGANNAFIGISLVEEADGLAITGNSANSYGYENNGNKKNNSSDAAYGNTWTTGDIVSCYLDLDNGAIYFGKNGTVQASGDPTSGASKTNAAYTFTTGGTYVLGVSDYYGTQQVNFGNPPFTISSGNTDGNGYGNFEYAVPSGYLSLCTANLSEVLG